MTSTKIWRNFDGLQLAIVAALVLFGAVTIYSAAYSAEVASIWTTESPVTRHLLYATIGIALLILAARVDYHTFGPWIPVIYLATVGILVAVLVGGQSIYGAKRWLDSPLVPIQPSEIAKTGTLIVLAYFFATRQQSIKSLRTTLLSLAIVSVPLLLVFVQPDLGTSVIFIAMWFGMAIIAGTPLLHFLALGIIGAVAVPMTFIYGLKAYQQERIFLFLNPAQDPLGAGYNILQSEISVGSGGLLGKGFLNGTQTQLHYLRIQKTDFIFSVIGEELGFIGAVVLFSLFALLLFRVLRSASLAPDSFGRLLATGVAMSILFQVFINIGVNVRLLPVTGIPLPFISSGGSSLISTMLALGLVQSVGMRRKRLHRFETT